MERRKELKLNYKQTLRPMGVYKIENTVTGKMYIGSSTNLDAVFNKHRFQLKLGSHFSKNLQKDWNEYGENNFSMEVIDVIKPDENVKEDYKKLLASIEEKWIAKYQPNVERVQ